MSGSSGETVVQVAGLSRHFKRKRALDGVDLTVRKGLVFGLVGENGAGKTTLIKHLLGLYKAKAGTVEVFGRDPVRDPEGVLSRIGYLSEDRDMPKWMRIWQLIRYAKAFYPDWDDHYAEELRAMFELDPQARIKDLSRGQLAKAGLLTALAHRPDLLLLDEPSSGLDPIVRRDILSAIIRTVADEGRTVIFSSHLLDEVERVADHVAMIHSGRKVLDAPLDELKEQHHTVELRLPGANGRKPELPGLLRAEREGETWTSLCAGDRDALQSAAESVGGEGLEMSTPSLEEVFVARASKQNVVEY
jgi:ABC-2 type transport system ATP-binding protein